MVDIHGLKLMLIRIIIKVLPILRCEQGASISLLLRLWALVLYKKYPNKKRSIFMCPKMGLSL